MEKYVFGFWGCLVNALEHEKAQGKAGRIALSLLRMDLVILDELGYLPKLLCTRCSKEMHPNYFCIKTAK